MLQICRQISKINISAIQQSTLQLQQARTKVHVTVLRRKYPIQLHKKGHRPKQLGHKRFIYEVVAHSGEGKEEPLDLILTQYVDGLGKQGEKVQVKRQFGYNNLLLPKLAVYATPENEELYGTGSDKTSKVVYSSKEAPRTMNFISNRIIDLSLNKEEPWTIEPWHIRTSARKAGIIIKNDSAIELPADAISGPDLNLEGREFYVTITVNKTEKVKVRCRIHHWSTEPGDRITADGPWFKTAEALIPEQEDVLKKMPLPIYKPKVKSILEYK